MAYEATDILPDCTVRLGYSAPGPRHLALLLKGAVGAVRRSSVFTVPTPTGVAKARWNRYLRAFAARRPLLWRNHRVPLLAGLLDTGRSAVMSLPTGAGKSALAEFRTAAEILRGRSVVYVAPTRSLVSQVKAQMESILRPVGAVRVMAYLEGDLADAGDADVTVLTPEACLVLLTSSSTILSELGLIVFDECHHLSGAAERRDGFMPRPGRRQIDANLALLQLVERSPAADVFLMSAMVENAEQLAGWIGSVTGRECVALTDPWKPTRQVRGMIAYEREELRELRRVASTERASGSSVSATASEMTAVPWGVFCHRLAWDAKATYKAMPLLANPVRLGLNTNWSLTSNRNVVAASLAAALVRAGIKTLVFAQDVNGTSRIANLMAESLADAQLPLVELPTHLRHLAAMETGGVESVVMPAQGIVGIHNATLLPTEREAMEEAYRDAEGLMAMVATPTLAQGMNLPAEAVVLAGDDRWDEDGGGDGGRRAALPIHEILNAAGRAGRAGMFAHGLVLVVPGLSVFSIERKKQLIEFDGLDHAMSILGRDDQCLSVTDPLEQVLDLIATGETLPDECLYLLRRTGSDEQDGGVSARLLRRSFGYHLAKIEGREAAFEELIETAVDAADELHEEEEELGALEEIARGLGIPSDGLRELDEALPDLAEIDSRSVVEWRDWIASHLMHHPSHLDVMINFPASGLPRIFPGNDSEDRELYLREVSTGLGEVLSPWMRGAPLRELEEILFDASRRKNRLGGLRLARRFAIDTGAALSGVSVLLQRLRSTRQPDAPTPLSLHLEALAGCLRLGFERPETLALYRTIARTRRTCRVEVHALERQLGGADLIPRPGDTMADVERRMHVVARDVGIV